jgi:hypothetical protein
MLRDLWVSVSEQMDVMTVGLAEGAGQWPELVI